MNVIELNDEKFTEKTKEGNIVVDCYAPWCGPCKMLSPIIDELAKKINNYTFYKINVDENPDVAEEYNIMSIPTLLIIKDGELKKQILGFKSKEELEDILK